MSVSARTAPITMLSQEDTAVLLGQIEETIANLGDHLAAVQVDGPLNAAQRAHLVFSRSVVAGLRVLFTAERVRLQAIAARVATIKES